MKLVLAAVLFFAASQGATASCFERPGLKLPSVVLSKQPLLVSKWISRPLLFAHGKEVSTSTSVLKLRGGGKLGDWVSNKNNLAAFFAFISLVNGVTFTFATPLAMKLFHNYQDSETVDGKAACAAVKLVGATMLGYGLLPYLAALKGMDPNKAMGWTLLPVILHLVGREVIISSKSNNFRSVAGAIASALTISAHSLITSDGGGLVSKDVAAMIPLGIIGLVASLCILFPVVMMQKMETAPLNKKGVMEQPSYRMKFVTQATGTHALCYLTLFFALWKGVDPYQSVGYAALATGLLALPVCVVLPNMRKSGAPIEPMIPFLVIFFMLAWKLGALGF